MSEKMAFETFDNSNLSVARKELIEKLLTARKNPKPQDLTAFNWKLSQEIMKDIPGNFSDYITQDRDLD